MFLDPVDRYLVFSTHLYLTVDCTDALGATKTLPSPRKHILADIPVSYNLTELRANSPVCSSLTVEEAQYYGGIPSLIYCSKLNIDDLSPKKFQGYIGISKVTTGSRKYISEVIDCLLTGCFLDATEEVKMLCSFSSVTSSDDEAKA